MIKFDLDTWGEILLTITRNKTRSLLTAFGIFWGIFMLLALLGGSQGVQDLMGRNFEGFATNSGFAFPNATTKPYAGFQQGRTWAFRNRDADLLKRRVKGIDVVAPVITSWSADVMYQQNKARGAALKGIDLNYRSIEAPKLLYGRYLNNVDISEARKVCVIGRRIYENLFPEGGNPCGKRIDIGGIYYSIVGVNVADGNMSIGGSAEQSILMPLSTLQRSLNQGDNVHLFCYTAQTGYAISDIEKEVEAILKQQHKIAPEDKEALQQFNAEAMFTMVDNLFKGIKILSWMVGLGTLLAGAIGVSNIMMVTVKERTSEIGIRRAIGAQPKDIVFQILAESMVLTIIAGAVGVMFSVMILDVLENATAEEHYVAHFVITFTQAVAAIFTLLALGLLAGFAPAMRAMSIKPIDAIRDE